jgi:hypothetical protein
VGNGGLCCQGTPVTNKDFGNFQEAHKSGKKFNDQTTPGTVGVEDATDPPIPNWPINLYTLPAGTFVTTNTVADGSYSFTISVGGNYRVCEGVGLAGFTQTFPHLGTVHAGETVVNTCPAPNVWGYEFTVTSGSNFTGDDFGNTPPSTTPPTCPEDPNRALLLTRTVGQSQFDGGPGTPGHPKNYSTVQAAYDAAKITGQAEVIGLFANTTENLVLDGSKALTITQCTIARVTAAIATLPVWDITSTGKLTIISPTRRRVSGSSRRRPRPEEHSGRRRDRCRHPEVSSGNSISWNDADGNGIGVDVRSNNT